MSIGAKAPRRGRPPLADYLAKSTPPRGLEPRPKDTEVTEEVAAMGASRTRRLASSRWWRSRRPKPGAQNRRTIAAFPIVWREPRDAGGSDLRGRRIGPSSIVQLPTEKSV